MVSVGTVVSYPIPAYANVPINSDFYQPGVFDIAALSLGTTTTVTTSTAQNYVIGQLIRLLIPTTFGSYQLNERQGYVISIPSTTQVVVTIDSTMADAFIAGPTTGPSVAQILAIGDINTGATNASGRSSTGTYIPGSFINISPQ